MNWVYCRFRRAWPFNTCRSSLQGRFSPASVADIVECEPALAAGVLSLAQRLAAGPVSQRHVVRLVLDRLDADDVRDVLLKTKVTAGFEIEFAGRAAGLAFP